MKLFLVCLLLPVALAAPLEDSKRFVLENFTLDSLFERTTLNCDLQHMVNVLGTDPTEQACEKECHMLMNDGLLSHSCPLICPAIINQVKYLHITPNPGYQHDNCR